MMNPTLISKDTISLCASCRAFSKLAVAVLVLYVDDEQQKSHCAEFTNSKIKNCNAILAVLLAAVFQPPIIQLRAFSCVILTEEM